MTKQEDKARFEFTKEQFLKSRNVQGHQKDLYRALLEDGKTYTIAQAQKIVEDFLKRTVTE